MKKFALFSGLITLSLIVAFSGSLVASTDNEAVEAASARFVQKVMPRPIPLDLEDYKGAINAYFDDLPVLTNGSVRKKFDEIFELRDNVSADHLEDLYTKLHNLSDPGQVMLFIDAFLSQQQSSLTFVRSDGFRRGTSTSATARGVKESDEEESDLELE